MVWLYIPHRIDTDNAKRPYALPEVNWKVAAADFILLC